MGNLLNFVNIPTSSLTLTKVFHSGDRKLRFLYRFFSDLVTIILIYIMPLFISIIFELFLCFLSDKSIIKGRGFLGPLISDIRANILTISVFRPFENHISVSFTIFVSASAEMCTKCPFSATKIGQFPTSTIFGTPPL